MTDPITIVGGGLAGSEAALQLARRDLPVLLHEMRPAVSTPAHETDRLAEVVCSNSFKSLALGNASGLLKEELRRAGSVLLEIAQTCRVEAGTALAIDRERFADAVTAAVTADPRITVRRGEVTDLPAHGLAILATGPLTSDAFARRLGEALGAERLFFHDATAPVVAAESIDRDIVFAANRRERGPGHYLNCPFDAEQYETFWRALVAAEPVPRPDFEDAGFFESCLPVDVLAARGRDTLRFGPLRPVGLDDPRTGRWPHAVAQLRPENREKTAYGLVGFQTRLRHGDQRRIFRLIPGLANAEFYRLGRVHRNTYLDGPRLLDGSLRVRREPRLFVAGQLTGLEGYVEALATGLLTARFAAAVARGREPAPPPPETALGSLLRFVSAYEGDAYRPTNVSFGLLPPLAERVRKGTERKRALAERALAALAPWCADDPGALAPPGM